MAQIFFKWVTSARESAESNWNFPTQLIKMQNIIAPLASEYTEKEKKETGKEEKLSLFTEEMIVYVENPKEFRKENLLEIITY